MFIIDNTKELNEFCQQLANYNIISVDTEFIRDRTYFAQLSIIQVMTKDHKVIIDALSKIDLASFKEVLLNDTILKIFHAPREDFEIFYHLFKRLPKNIFDIQLAANICNFGKYLSYADICSKICYIQVDKTYQRSDWLKRPIDTKMLNYAIKDVEYLQPIYQILQPRITRNNLQNEYNNQLNALLNVENYMVNTEKAWKKVRFNNHTLPFIKKMQIIAGYREEYASKIDIPRRHFIPDEDLVKICQYLPVNDQDFKNLKLDSNYLHKKIYRAGIGDLCIGLRELNYGL